MPPITKIDLGDGRTFELGDAVVILDPSSDKHGIIGRVHLIASSGAIIEITPAQFTPVKYTHLAKVKNAPPTYKTK